MIRFDDTHRAYIHTHTHHSHHLIKPTNIDDNVSATVGDKSKTAHAHGRRTEFGELLLGDI